MQKLLRLNQSLGEIETESGVFELLATAEATHDKRTGTIVVMLNSFLQLQRTKRPGAHLFAHSSVGRRTVTKEAAEEEYAETVGSIFASWVHCLEQTSPERSAGARIARPASAAANDVIPLPT
jgi:hypothetical protein